MNPTHLPRPGRFQYAFLQKALTVCSLIVTLAVSIPFFAAAEKFKLPFLNAIGAVLFLVGLFVTVFTVREVLYRMEEEGTLLFRDAVSATLNGYILKLCFLPVIGPRIERRWVNGKAKNPFVAENEK